MDPLSNNSGRKSFSECYFTLCDDAYLDVHPEFSRSSPLFDRYDNSLDCPYIGSNFLALRTVLTSSIDFNFLFCGGGDYSCHVPLVYPCYGQQFTPEIIPKVESSDALKLSVSFNLDRLRELPFPVLADTYALL